MSENQSYTEVRIDYETLRCVDDSDFEVAQAVSAASTISGLEALKA